MADTVKTIVIKVDGKDALVDINEIKDSLKSTNEEVGEMKGGGLGGFSNEIGDLTGKFKAGEIGIKGLGKGVLSAGKAMMTAFVTNPILLAIAAIVVVVVLLVDIFKTFQPLVDAIEKSFAALVAVFNVFKATVLDVITGNKSLKESFSGMGDAMKEAAKAAWDLKAAEQALNDSMVDLELSAARTKTQIDKLMIQSTDVTKSEKERIKALEEVLALQKDQHEKNVKWADESKRITLEKIIIGKNFTFQEIKDIRRLGIVKLRELQKSHAITDDEIAGYKDALVAKEKLLQEEIAITENAKVQRNAIQQEGAAKRQEAADKAASDKKDADDKAASEQAAIDSAMLDKHAQILENRRKLDSDYVDETIKLTQKGVDERFAIIENGREKRLKEIYEENLVKEKEIYDNQQRELGIKNLGDLRDLHRDRAARMARKQLAEEFFDETLKLEDDAAKKSIELQKTHNEKYFEKDIKVQEALLDNVNLTTAEEIKIKTKMSQIRANFKYAQLKLDDDLTKKLISNAKSATDEKTKMLLLDHDLYMTKEQDKLDDLTLKSDEIRDIYYNLSSENVDAFESGLISEKEYHDNKFRLAKESVDRLTQLQEAQLQAGLDTINKLSEADAAATQTAINLQDRKLANGEITQKEYDKKVAEIQNKAAKREKAYAVAAAIINTAQGISKALASVPPPLSFILAAATGVLGAAQIAAILSTPIDGSSVPPPSIGGVDTSSSNTAPNTSFSFSPEPTTPTNEPVKTYIISKDVTTQTQLDRQIISNGTI